jgi:inhibitor of KinA
MRCVPLGDQAILVYLSDESAAVRFAAAVRAAAPPWLQDVVPAYASVGVFFDADLIGLSAVTEWLQQPPSGGREPPEPSAPQGAHAPRSARLHRIPVCYEMQHDLARVCQHIGLPADSVIRLHTAVGFTVYAVGFVAGFPYLGYLPAGLCGVPRLESPRPRVEPGSVGLTGRQTGIYPVPRPGGWNLIGRTPLVVVDVADGFFPLRVGDTVRFERIDDAEFRRLEGERLGPGEPSGR